MEKHVLRHFPPYFFLFVFETEGRHANVKAQEAINHLASFLSSREEILSWMMDEIIHWPKPYFLLSTICAEILS
jgi:hypothetical protein